jgi:hypothetical protein
MQFRAGILASTLAARTTARLVHEYELAERWPVHWEHISRANDRAAGA